MFHLQTISIKCYSPDRVILKINPSASVLEYLAQPCRDINKVVCVDSNTESM